MRKKGKNREDKTEGWPLFTAVPKQESRGTGKDWRDWQKPKERHKILQNKKTAPSRQNK